MITLNEISANLAKRYMRKAKPALANGLDKYRKEYDREDNTKGSKTLDKMGDRAMGIKRANTVIGKDKDKKTVIKPAEETTESTRRTVKSTVSRDEAGDMLADARHLTDREDGGRVYQSPRHGVFALRKHPTEAGKFELSKVMHEDVLDELSKDTLKHYDHKASTDAEDKNRRSHGASEVAGLLQREHNRNKNSGLPSSDEFKKKADDLGKAAKKRYAGIALARRKIAIKESLSSLFMDGDMVENAGGAEGVVRAHNNATFIVEWADGATTVHDQVSGRRWTMEGLTDDDAVQLTELSKDTLKSYKDKAHADLDDAINGANSMHAAADRSDRNGRAMQKRFGIRPGEMFGVGTSGYRDGAKYLEKIASRRVRGIHRVDQKLNKEEVEEAEKAKLTDMLKNDHKAYKLQDTVDKDGKKKGKIVSRPTKEDVDEQFINELSKQTLSSYRGKAAADASVHNADKKIGESNIPNSGSENLFEESDTHNDEDRKFQDAVDKHPVLSKTFGSASPHKVKAGNDVLRMSGETDAKIYSHQHRRSFDTQSPHSSNKTHYTLQHVFHPTWDAKDGQHAASISAENSGLKDRVTGEGKGKTAEEALDNAHKAFAADHKAHKFHMYKKVAGALT